MAKPTTRQELKDYALRQLGYPVLEINVADEQVDDALDDSLQLFQERHFDGVERVLLKYKITEDDIKRGRARGASNTLGISTSTTTSGDFEENSNYLVVPDAIIGVEKLYLFDSSFIANNMFSFKYQLFLNDVAFNLGYSGLLSYAMTKTYIEDIDFLLSTDKQIRFNQRQDRLYLDIDWASAAVDSYIIIDCNRLLDPNDFTRVYNDSFLKKYLTILIKRQWGQNLIKFQGVKLPGGIELNGGEILQQAESELADIKGRMMSEYELPPLDFIG